MRISKQLDGATIRLLYKTIYDTIGVSAFFLEHKLVKYRSTYSPNRVIFICVDLVKLSKNASTFVSYLIKSFPIQINYYSKRTYNLPKFSERK